MTPPEFFNDRELANLLEAETARGAQDYEVAKQYTVIHDKLWSAIETLETQTYCGPDPDHFDEEYDALVDILRAVAEADSFEGSRDLLERHIHMRAREIWDNDVAIIAQIALAIEEQLYPTEQSIDESLIKKTLTAKLIAGGDDMERWLPLIDYALTGDPLDTSRFEDMEIMMQAIENHANEDSMPQVLLCQQILAVLGVEEIITPIDDVEKLQRIDTYTLAARDFTELAYYMSGQEAQPNRHEKMYELFRAYKISDNETIHEIIKLTDAFETVE